jgi:hypothetical protein
MRVTGDVKDKVPLVKRIGISGQLNRAAAILLKQVRYIATRRCGRNRPLVFLCFHPICPFLSFLWPGLDSETRAKMATANP